MPDISAGHAKTSAVGGAARTLALLPEWLAVVWAVIFVAVAITHVHHLLQSAGQQRPWHACHVALAIGMAFMYTPARLDPLIIPSAFWQALFATIGIVATTWAIAGDGRVSTLVWLLTSADLGTMLFMWTDPGDGGAPVLSCLAVTYLLGAALMWALDLHRRLEHRTPIVSWRLLAIESGLPAPGLEVDLPAGSTGLIGNRDISFSMIVMCLGMSYMLVAMAT